MRTCFFVLVLILLLVAGGFTLLHQQRQLASLRAEWTKMNSVPQVSNTSTGAQSKPPPEPTNPARAASELLRLRGEVSVLRRDLDARTSGVVSRRQAEDDWALVHSGAKPSDYPGFIFLTNCVRTGCDTPAAALQSFYFAMRNQEKEPLTPSRMKQLWDVPDDFDVPGAAYSIDLGEGIGREQGYRLVDQQPLGNNEVRLTLEFERPDGSAFRRNLVLVEHNGIWRLKPARVFR